MNDLVEKEILEMIDKIDFSQLLMEWLIELSGINTQYCASGVFKRTGMTNEK